MLSKHVKCEHANIKRNLIKNAEYNPRIISEDAQKKLKEILKKTGLCQSLVWNKRTGNLVGGHQRITILDQLEKSQDYEIPCDVVDLDLKEEVKLNIQLNQTSAMGEFDPDKLQDLHFEFPDLDFMKDFAFDKADLDFMFNDVNKILGKNQLSEAKKNVMDAEKFHERKKEYRDNVESTGKYDETGWNNMVTIVFNTQSEKENFLKKIHIKPGEKYIKSTKIFDITKEEFRW